MTELLDRALNDLTKLQQQISVHAEAIRHHQAEKERAEKAAAEIETFIRLLDRYRQETHTFEEVGAGIDGITAKERILRVAAEEINRLQHRTPFDVIYRAVLNAGIQIGGKDEAKKRNNVSGVLSRDPNFDGIRHKGWWLKSLGPCPDDAKTEDTETAGSNFDDSSTASTEPRPDQRGNGSSESENPWPGGST